ncbi:hypothetical protein DFH11DRAFT_1731627 [Phellopilus nigrolimitatus]|nr:hypothetical protein DFH11DRAFT_1731627 [Phellopilus nigrolimitatus]
MQVYASSSSPMSPPPFARHPENRQSQLLTPVSHFPSRMLPPPGTTPRVLPGVIGQQISMGAAVEVRRFNMRTKEWMPWIPGIIIGHRIERFHVGTEVDLYDVQTTYPNTWMETYIPFLGELRDGLYFNPSDNAREMMDKVADMKKVFACVQVPSSNGSSAHAWLPAIVTSRRSEPVPQVYVLAGPLRGQKSVSAPHILPYNIETAEAIRKTGQAIYWEKGTD